MPPKTRRRAAVPSQTTLSFNSRNKVTKPALDSTPATKKRLSDPAKEVIVEEISTPITQDQPAEEVSDVEVEQAPAQQPSSPAQQPRKKKRVSAASTHSDSREAAAEKITDAQIKKYWQREEESRLAPRVHQKDLHLHEKILRHFDLSTQFGSCIGINRLARWKRANRLDLEPPIEVLAVLLREMEGGVTGGDAKKQKKTASRGGCSMMAYIDELGNGRVGVVDA